MVAIFDLGGFKQYNDTFGHLAGDALLVRLCGRLSAAMDGIGTAYRMGGDEFCLVAPTGATPQRRSGVSAARRRASRAPCS